MPQINELRNLNEWPIQIGFKGTQIIEIKKNSTQELNTNSEWP
jgi:hypothetical protein